MITMPSGIKKIEASDNATIVNQNINADLLNTKVIQGDKATADIGDKAALLTAAKTDVVAAVNELFTNVSNLKTKVAIAVTDKGVATSANDTGDTMAANIRAIKTGVETGDATVVAGDMRSGKTAYGAAGTKITGTIPVQTGGNVIPIASDIVKSAGIYDTPITVKGVVVPAAKVLNDTTIAGTPGTMPNNGARNGTITTQGGIITIPAGYTTGGTVTASFANLIAGNLRNQVNVGGVVGTLVEGKPFATGSTPISGSLTISGLSFRPRFVFIFMRVGGDRWKFFVLSDVLVPSPSSSTIYGFSGSRPTDTSYISEFTSNQITSNGFSIGVSENSTYEWHAYGY